MAQERSPPLSRCCETAIERNLERANLRATSVFSFAAAAGSQPSVPCQAVPSPGGPTERNFVSYPAKGNLATPASAPPQRSCLQEGVSSAGAPPSSAIGLTSSHRSHRVAGARSDAYREHICSSICQFARRRKPREFGIVPNADTTACSARGISAGGSVFAAPGKTGRVSASCRAGEAWSRRTRGARAHAAEREGRAARRGIAEAKWRRSSWMMAIGARSEGERLRRRSQLGAPANSLRLWGGRLAAARYAFVWG